MLEPRGLLYLALISEGTEHLRAILFVLWSKVFSGVQEMELTFI